MVRTTVFASVLSIVTVLIPVPAFGQGTAADNEIRVAMKSDIRSTMPGRRGRDANTDNVLLHVVEGLVAYREDLSIGPMLAESWQVSKDGKAYTFKLRRGVKFHNGATMTSADVKWSYERFMDAAKGEWQCRNFFDGSRDLKVEAVETPDADTVIFKLDRPNSIFLDKLAHIQCTLAVLHKDSVAADGTWKEPVATGPFKIGEWKKGESVQLVPFAGYSSRSDAASGYAGMKKAHHPVRFVVIPEASSQRAALESGQIHLMPFVIQDGVPKADGDIDVFVKEGLEWNILLMQTRDPLLKDIRIRKAIAHAVDVPALVKAASQGRARANPSVVPSTSRYYSEAHRKWLKFDPPEAMRLLKEAGYNGQVIKMQVNKNYPNMYDNAVIMQDMLGKVGIKVELQLYDWPTQLANYASGNFQAMMFGYSARLDPGLGYLALTGSKDINKGMQWDNRKADEIIGRANQELDFEKRKRIFEELHELFVQDIPAINLYNHPLIDVASKRLVGYKAWSTSKVRLFNVQLKR